MCTCDQWYKRVYISINDTGSDLNGTDVTTVGSNETEVKNSHECVRKSLIFFYFYLEILDFICPFINY